jgi:hypothetical protein
LLNPLQAERDGLRMLALDEGEPVFEASQDRLCS